MKKLVYQSPKVNLVLIYPEESIASGSTITADAFTSDETVTISEYETYEEGNKDFNINF